MLPKAVDPDGDYIKISLAQNTPRFIKLQNDQLVFIPTSSDIGTYIIKIHLSDYSIQP